jgi:hypothetical protein
LVSSEEWKDQESEGSRNTLDQVATAISTTPPFKAIDRHTNPLALWHLLSLDAPTIAALWTWFIASASHVRLSLTSTVAMALTVWILYAADRLMDARLLSVDPSHHEGLEARHYFHHRYSSAFLAGILCASIVLAALLPHLEPDAIHLYLVLGGFVFGYFILIHATGTATARQKVARLLPKEITVGLCFAAATFIPTVARRPDLRMSLLPSALFFATLCSLNCLYIYAWEHEPPRTNRPAHAITRLALRNLPQVTTLLALSAAALTLLAHRSPWPIPCAIGYSVALLLLLHNCRLAIAPVTLRAAADLALTTPLLFVLFLH